MDGIKGTNIFHDTCTHTIGSGSTNPWWRVDLEELLPVSEIYILNRGDCCGERLKGFEIRVGEYGENWLKKISIISEVIIRIGAFWLVEKLGLWGYNNPARGDYSNWRLGYEAVSPLTFRQVNMAVFAEWNFLFICKKPIQVMDFKNIGNFSNCLPRLLDRK